MQADAPFRARAEDIGQLKARNAAGEMVPLSALVKVTPTHGPERAMRYNGFLPPTSTAARRRAIRPARRRPRSTRIAGRNAAARA